SHLDRVVAGASGESPAAFRRRILLERAAYRLVTSQAAILDVAVEAGYSSHEAFTRAFSRAYGAAPAGWRRRPTRLHIDAPSDVHFHPPGGLRLPARQKVSSMDLVRSMIDHHVWLVGEMLTRAATLDEDRLDARIDLSVEGIDDEPTLRSLLSRLVGQLAMWNAAIDGRDYDFAVEHGESVSGMQSRLAEVGPAFAAQVAGICEQDRLDEMLICPGESVEVYTYGAMIAHVLTFAAHRRTLVAGALYDAGFTDLDAGDPIRWITSVT
ncbi:MAG: helix-turn-helix domain-containing protein, partial [Nocardioidaceae bacterium]